MAAPNTQQPPPGCAPGDDLNGNSTCDDFEYEQPLYFGEPSEVGVCVAAEWDSLRAGGDLIPAPTFVQAGSGQPRLVQWNSIEDLEQLVRVYGAEAFLGADGNGTCYDSETTTLDPNGADLRGYSTLAGSPTIIDNAFLPAHLPPIEAGSQLDYLIGIYNFGPRSAAVITATFTLPQGTELLEALYFGPPTWQQAACDSSSFPTVTCDIPDLPIADGSPGPSADAFLRIILNATGPLTIPVSLTSSVPDPNPSNNYMALQITVIGDVPPADCNIAWAFVTLDIDEKASAGAVGGDVDPSDGCQVTLSIENLRTQWTSYSISADPDNEVTIQPHPSPGEGLLPPAPYKISHLALDILLDLLGQGTEIQHLITFTEAGQTVRVDVFPTEHSAQLNLLQLLLDVIPLPVVGDFPARMIQGQAIIDLAYEEMPDLKHAAMVLFGPTADGPATKRVRASTPYFEAFAGDPVQKERLAELFVDLGIFFGNWFVQELLDEAVSVALTALGFGAVPVNSVSAMLRYLGAYDIGRQETGSIMVITSSTASSINCDFAPELCRGSTAGT